ncbi:MAG TPA: hypothetical protein VF802_00410 [Candidatus Limnocylindrales bacterium]
MGGPRALDGRETLDATLGKRSTPAGGSRALDARDHSACAAAWSESAP